MLQLRRNLGTYIPGVIRDETRGIDLHIGTAVHRNSTPLKVACPPPGIGAKNVQESSETKFVTTSEDEDDPEALLLSNVLS